VFTALSAAPSVPPAQLEKKYDGDSKSADNTTKDTAQGSDASAKPADAQKAPTGANQPLPSPKRPSSLSFDVNWS